MRRPAKVWAAGARGGARRRSPQDAPAAPSPSRPRSRSSAAAAGLDAGRFHSCATLPSARLRCWGYGGDGALGYGDRLTIGDDETPAAAGPVDLGAGVTVDGGGGRDGPHVRAAHQTPPCGAGASQATDASATAMSAPSATTRPRLARAAVASGGPQRHRDRRRPGAQLRRSRRRPRCAAGASPSTAGSVTRIPRPIPSTARCRRTSATTRLPARSVRSRSARAASAVAARQLAHVRDPRRAAACAASATAPTASSATATPRASATTRPRPRSDRCSSAPDGPPWRSPRATSTRASCSTTATSAAGASAPTAGSATATPTSVGVDADAGHGRARQPRRRAAPPAITAGSVAHLRAARRRQRALLGIRRGRSARLRQSPDDRRRRGAGGRRTRGPRRSRGRRDHGRRRPHVRAPRRRQRALLGRRAQRRARQLRADARRRRRVAPVDRAGEPRRARGRWHVPAAVAPPPPAAAARRRRPAAAEPPAATDAGDADALRGGGRARAADLRAVPCGPSAARPAPSAPPRAGATRAGARARAAHAPDRDPGGACAARRCLRRFGRTPGRVQTCPRASLARSGRSVVLRFRAPGHRRIASRLPPAATSSSSPCARSARRATSSAPRRSAGGPAASRSRRSARRSGSRSPSFAAARPTTTRSRRATTSPHRRGPRSKTVSAKTR